MFRNRWRKTAFYIWIITIPTALTGAMLYVVHAPESLATGMIGAGIAGSVIALFVLKAGGSPQV